MILTRMKLRITLSVLLTIPVVAFCAFYFRTVEPGVLEASPGEIRVDSMFGKHESVIVQLRNVGGLPVEISGVSSSCGCTVAKPKENHIPPGASTSLEIEVHANSVGRKDAVVGVAYGTTEDRRMVQVPIMIHTKEASGTQVLFFPRDLSVRLDVHGANRTEFHVRTLEANEKESDLLELTSTDDRCQFKIVDIEVSSAEPNQADKSNKIERNYRIELSISGTETFSAIAKMRFREPIAAPVGDIAIVVRPKARTRIVPPKVDLTENQAASSREKSEVLLISEVDVENWKLVNPERCPKWLTVEIERLNSNLTRLRLNDSRLQAGQAEGIQTLELQSTSSSELVSIPIRINE